MCSDLCCTLDYRSRRAMRTTNADLLTVFKAADRSGDLPAAWAKHGKPTTLKNARRAYTTYCKGKAAAAATVEPAYGRMAARVTAGSPQVSCDAAGPARTLTP